MKNSLLNFAEKSGKYFFAIYILLVMCFITGIVRAQTAVTVNNATSGRTFDTIVGVTSLTFPHTINAGTSRALFVGVSTSKDSVVMTPGIATSRVQSVTYAGITMTPIAVPGTVPPDTAVLSPAPNFQSAVELFVLTEQATAPNPLPASGNVVITIKPTAVTSVNFIVGGAITFNNVNQVNPNSALVPARGNSNMPILSITAGNGDIVLDTVATSFNAIDASPGAGQTLQWLGNFPDGDSGSDVGGGSTEAAPALPSSTVTMSWTLTFAMDWALGAIAVKASPDSTASPSSVSGRVLTQSGRGVSKAFVYLTDSAGKTQSALTNPFGYFRFKEVQAGETYILSVSSKRYSFTPQTLSVISEFNELNFTAQP